MRLRPFLSLTLALQPLLPALAASSGDEAPELLRARAEAPAAPVGEFLGPGGTGNRLFFFVGADNAECVRSTPDVNGDGRDEILVGIGESGTDNFYCLDGASAGAASVVWSLETMDGASGGYVNGDQSIVPVPDTDGNGSANVLLGTAWGGRTAYDFDTASGAETWSFDTYLEFQSGWIYSLASIDDFDGDGTPEIAFGVGSNNDSVYLVDGASAAGQAAVRWRYAAGDAVYSVRNIGDANGDGTADVLAAVGDNIDRIVCLEGDATGGGNVLWTYVPGVSVYACGVLSDITGDGVDEALAVLWTSGGSAVRCVNGATGVPVWASTDVPDFGMQAHEIEDVTGDGVHDVVVSSWENAAIVLDGSDGSLVWKTTVGTTNGGDVWTSRPIDDITGDGVQDVIAGSFDYSVYAFDGTTGALFWSYDTGNRVFSVHPVGDLNGDGTPEVVAGTQDTNSLTVVHVLEGNPAPVLGTPFCFGVGCPCGNDDPSAGCFNSTGSGALLEATAGSTSVVADDLVLTAVDLPPNNSGLFFMGATEFASPVIVDDGLGCTGGLFRFLPGVVSATGEFTATSLVADAPVGQILPGDSRSFQAWTRDVLCGPPPSPCPSPCGSNSNLSNGVTVTFGP